MTEDLGEKDDGLTDEEQARVDQLTKDDLHSVDATLLANCSFQFRKVVKVVGATMNHPSSAFNGIPDVFCSQRVTKLVEAGRLEHQGTLGSMRFCEVQLPHENLSLEFFEKGQDIPQKS